MSMGNPFKTPEAINQSLAGPVMPGMSPLSRSIPGYSPFSNKMAQMGGFNDILSQDKLKDLSSADLDAYKKNISTAKGQGMSDLLYALGGVIRGDNTAVDTVNQRKTTREQNKIAELDRIRKEEDRQRKLNKETETEKLQKEMADKFASGDIEGAMAVGLKMGDGSSVQNMYNMERDRREKLEPTITEDGLVRTYNPTTGEYDFSVNQSLLDANKIVSDNTPLSTTVPSSLVDDELKDFTAMDDLDFQIADANKFLGNLDEGMLEFGVGESVQDFFGQFTPSGLMSDESQTKLDNKNDYNRFINETRDAFLKMETGTKTDDDAARALKRLETANNPESVRDLLVELEALAKQQKINKQKNINRRREAAGVVPKEFIDYQLNE